MPRFPTLGGSTDYTVGDNSSEVKTQFTGIYPYLHLKSDLGVTLDVFAGKSVSGEVELKPDTAASEKADLSMTVISIGSSWPFACGLESGIVEASIREAVANGEATLAQTYYGEREAGRKPGFWARLWGVITGQK